MEIIKRYIYDVTRRLPKNQREEISREIESLIDDILIEKGYQKTQAPEEIVEGVLHELGHPEELASNYYDGATFLIGPKEYFLFTSVMKIVLGVTGAILGLIFLFEAIEDPFKLIDHFVEVLLSGLTIVPMLIGWIVIGFFLMKYTNKDFGKAGKWSIDQLPKLPSDKQGIKRSEPILGIIIYSILMMVLIFSKEYFGLWLFKDGEFSGIIPFLHEAMNPLTYALLLFLLGIWILKDAVKLFYERWTTALAAFITIINSLSIALVITLFYTKKVWNSNFLQEAVDSGYLVSGSNGYEVFRSGWENSTYFIPILLIIGLAGEIVYSYWKAARK